MFGASVHFVDYFYRVTNAEKVAEFRNLGHASATIRRDVITSIKVDPEPSPVGTPVHSRAGLFKSSLFYDVSHLNVDAVIGLAYSRVAISGEPHEKGTFYKGYKYRKRPFMLPGLMKSLPRLSAYWEGSIG